MNGYNCCALRKVVSISTMKMLTEGVGSLAPIAVPDICLQIFSLDSE